MSHFAARCRRKVTSTDARRRALVAGAVLILFLPALLFAGPSTSIPNSSVAGGYIKVTSSEGEAGVPARAELKAPDGTLLSANKFFPIRGANELEVAALIGVPCDISPGTYRITVLTASDVVVAGKDVEITSGEFISETIELDGPMSELRRTDDPRRERESRELWEILNSSDTRAFFHTGPFRIPLAESVRSSHYGDRRSFLYTDGGADRSIHRGIDLVAPFGSPVCSSGRGRVVFSDERIITGNTVVVEHLPGVYSLYYHLDRLHVRKGDYVGEGQVLGFLGATGLVTGAHLHWEIRIGGQAVNPDLMADFEL